MPAALQANIIFRSVHAALMTHAKSDREALHQWLSAASARMRWSLAARDLGWLTAAIVALWMIAKALPS
ncbi:MAG: hypothetical protein EXR36_05550 [Betaproteobacteria bacterium]|nr:hypothetical protein [Betaproteobacteria bacterium]